MRDQIRTAEQLLYRQAQAGLGYYLQSVVINAQPDPAPFGRVAEWWQRDLIRPKIPAFEHLAGITPASGPGSYSGPLSFWDVLARGHDKSSLEARIATWLLLASKRIVHGYIIAADREQGQLILQAMEDEHKLNPWIGRYVSVQKNQVIGPAGEVTVLPADVASSYGLRGNLYICDEVTHWKNQKMWGAVLSGREKVTPSILCVLSNAGTLNSWQHEAFRIAQADPGEWSTFYRKGFLASWGSAERWATMRRMLPPSEAARLLDNVWIDPASEHDYLRRSEVEHCGALGRQLGLEYRFWRATPNPDNYVASIDYGPKKDRTVLVVQHMNGERLVEVDRMDVYEGRSEPSGSVKVEKVHAWIKEAERVFHPKLWVCDPYQMLGTIEWMEDTLRLNVERYSARGGAGNFEMAQALRAAVVNREVAWYPQCGKLDTVDPVSKEQYTETLEDELASLVVKKMPYGFRFDHEHQRHDDRAVALAMGLLRTAQFPPANTSARGGEGLQIVEEPGYNPLLGKSNRVV